MKPVVQREGEGLVLDVMAPRVSILISLVAWCAALRALTLA